MVLGCFFDPKIWAIYSDQTAEVTPNGSLVRESPQNPRNNSGLGITRFFAQKDALRFLKFGAWCIFVSPEL